MIEVTDDTFAELVIDASSEKPIVVDFWAEWCNPCKAMLPVLESINESDESFEIVKFQASRESKIVSQYGVRTVPTLMIFRNGSVVATKVGQQTRDALITFIQSASNHG